MEANLAHLPCGQGERPRLLVHGVGIVRFDPLTREDISRLNTQGTRNVLDAARVAGVRRVVRVSSVVAVGDGTLAELATEETPSPFGRGQGEGIRPRIPHRGGR